MRSFVGRPAVILVAALLALWPVGSPTQAQSNLTRPVLGVQVEDAATDGSGFGARVVSVAPGSAAASAGVQPNDVITAIDGTIIPSGTFLRLYLAAQPAGKQVQVHLRRDGVETVAVATLGIPPATPPQNRPLAPAASATPQKTPQKTTSAAGADTAQGWTVFTDPNEQAYTIDVPAGWHVEGGLVRHGLVQVGLFLRALSPDKAIVLILGDPGKVYFSTPGFDNLGHGAPYLAGADYARAYVQQALPSYCTGLSYQESADMPDLANGKLAQMTPTAHHDAGSATFACTRGGKPARVFMAAATYLVPAMVRGNASPWGVSLLAGCIAPPDRLDATKRLVRHMLETAQFQPAWLQQQQARIREARYDLAAVTQQMQELSERSIARAKAQMRDMQQESASFDQILTQTGTFAAPSGQRFELDNTQPYHWFNSGRTAETPGPNPPPGPGWQPMQPVAPQ